MMPHFQDVGHDVISLARMCTGVESVEARASLCSAAIVKLLLLTTDSHDWPTWFLLRQPSYMELSATTFETDRHVNVTVQF